MEKIEKEVIQVHADPELKRRVERAAAKHNIPVAEYCLEAIEQKLADDTALEEAGIAPLSHPGRKMRRSLMIYANCMTKF
jgi:hypothetical protein